MAIIATLTKLVFLFLGEPNLGGIVIWPQLLGTLPIVLPLLAVGGLSWTVALDSEARVETFRETRNYLIRQKKILEQADTSAEYDRLLIETEGVLLGEVANWFSRRSNTKVT